MLRFSDTEVDSLRFPFANDYLKYQLPSLEKALEPIIPRIDELEQFIQIAKAKCHFPSEHSLTLDESAAIFLYTMEWDDNSFYYMIKRDLCSTDRSISQSWFLYLKLFDTAVQKLPHRRMNVWRGINQDTCKKLKKGDEFIWWSITSCSSSDSFIKDCLKQNSTLCSIEAVNGKDISIYSNFPNQNEVILCPVTRMQVVKIVQDQTSSSLLHLRESNRQMSSSSTNNGIINNISSRWYNNRILALVPHLIVLIIVLLLSIIARKVLTTFESSYIATVLSASSYQAMQVTYPSKSEFGHTTIIDKSSTFHIHIDTFGNKYEGEWKDGKKHGKGKMVFANGHSYTGDWINDMATGEGISIWTNGDRYEGQMKDGQRHGKGSYHFANGDKYTGDWIADKKEGHGITNLAVGRYEGQFKDDKMHGKGSFYFTNGDTYVGDWIDGKEEGQGIFNWVDGDKYEGEFKAGKLHGQGSYYFGNGNKFIGYWVDGERMTDHGAFIWANNAQLSEESKDSKKHEPS
jgi:hypothetical protein